MSKSIFIATPMYGGMCSGIYAESLAKSIKGLIDLGYNINYCPLHNESLITRARNILTEVFLKTNSDYLLFIDSDQSFEYQDIHKMICEDKEILGALVPMKKINWEAIEMASKFQENNLEDFSGVFNFNPLMSTNGVTPDLSKAFEVEYIGTGMMLIKKEVFYKLKTIVPKYKHNSGLVYGINDGDIVHEYFSTSIDSNSNLLSEDYHFCSIAKTQNYKIHAVSYPKIYHAGTYFFKGKLNNQ
jgi:hypothetical protein